MSKAPEAQPPAKRAPHKLNKHIESAHAWKESQNSKWKKTKAPKE